MSLFDIQNEISLGEDSRRQFKVNFHNPEQVAAEIVAFLNGSGGRTPSMLCLIQGLEPACPVHWPTAPTWSC